MQSLRQESLGYSAEDLAALDVREPLPEQRPRELPAHNGFGSWEDSAQNCTSLVKHIIFSMADPTYTSFWVHEGHQRWNRPCLFSWIPCVTMWCCHGCGACPGT